MGHPGHPVDVIAEQGAVRELETREHRVVGRVATVGGDMQHAYLGGTGGEEAHTLTTAQAPSRAITIPTRDSGSVGSGGAAVLQAGNATANSSVTLGSTNGGNGAHNNVQPTVILNKIIYAGV